MTLDDISAQWEEEPSFVKDGARQFSAIWGEKTELADNLISVALDCVADKDAFHYEDAHLVLYYYFNNATSVEDEQDDVF